jgi:hypothetical protein
MEDSIGNTFLFVKKILATKYRAGCGTDVYHQRVNSVYCSLKFCIFIWLDILMLAVTCLVPDR